MGRARGPGRVPLGLVQLEPDKYVQYDDQRPRGQKEEHRRKFKRVRQLVRYAAHGQLGYDGSFLVLRVHYSHLDGLKQEKCRVKQDVLLKNEKKNHYKRSLHVSRAPYPPAAAV